MAILKVAIASYPSSHTAFARGREHLQRASTRIRESTAYQAVLGTPGKRFWGVAGIANIAVLGSFAAYGIDSIATQALAGHYASAFLTAIHSATFSYFTVLSVTMPTIANIRRAIMAPDPKPALLPENQLPTVTVQIPTRNEPLEVVVENALTSALKLNYPREKIEIQVIDNSDAGRYEQLMSYCLAKGVTFIHRDGVEGAKAENLNIGLKVAHGDYVLVLDADNRVEEDFLQNLTAEIVRDPSLAYVYANVDYWNEEQSLFTRLIGAVNNYHRSLLWSLDKLGFSPFNGFGVLLDRQKMAEVGNWDGEMVGEDWDLAARLTIAGYRGKRVSHTIVHDAIPATLERYQIQQRRWAYGSTQNLDVNGLAFLKNGDIPWNVKLDYLYRLSYYPGASFCLVVPAVANILLGSLSTIQSEEVPSSMFSWWMAAWGISTLQPFLASIADKTSKVRGTKSLKTLFPGFLTSAGMLTEVTSGLFSYLKGNKEGFRVTPKGTLVGSTFLEAMRKYRNEITLGAAIACGTFWVAGGGLYIFIGLGLLLSPLISWTAERHPRSPQTSNAFVQFSEIS